MSTRYRGTSPNRSQKVISDEAKEIGEKAREAYLRRNSKSSSFFADNGYQIVIGVFVAVIVLALGHTFFSKSRNPDVTPVIDQDEIDYHNSSGYTYKLGSNDHFQNQMLTDAKNKLNASLSSRDNFNKCPSSEDSAIIPESYDFREAFPTCVGETTQAQGDCASSYAIASASAMSDRLCRNHPGNAYIELSPQPLIDCDSGYSMGCKGGYVSRGFDYAKKNGLPSVTDYPYTGSESSQCENLQGLELHQVEGSCLVQSEEGIKREILQNGPVVSVIPVYRDFLVYKEGTYKVIDGVSAFRSSQALKIVGWNQDSNGSYWIVQNSWGESWGQNGYAHIYTKQAALHLDEYALAPTIEQPQQEQQQEEQQQEQQEEQQQEEQAQQ